MSNSLDKLVSVLQKSLLETEDRKPKPYDTPAEVRRVEGSIAYVHIPGGVDETPVKLTSSADIGDEILVRVANGSAWGIGNSTNPPTDDRVAIKAQTTADGASKIAGEAFNSANAAKMAADYANEQAEVARSAADRAETDAALAKTAANEAKESADDAGAEASLAKTAANEAKESADDAGAEASRARAYADNAFDQLSVVENVVGVLDLLQKNGEYQFTPDEVIDSGKWYFERSGASPNYIYSVANNPTSVYHLTNDTAIESGKTYYTRSGTGTSEDPYVYTEVATPVVADISTYYEKYYELVGIDEAIQNYVSSQLVVDDNGLWLKRPEETGIQTKVLLSSTDGVVLYGANGQIVGKYGETAQIGDSAGFHIEIDGTELGFYQAENKVAYINNNQLYITQSVVLQQMDLGTPVSKGGLGQWSWKVHANGQTPSRNNLNLKWIG